MLNYTSNASTAQWAADRVKKEVEDFLRVMIGEALLRWDYPLVQKLLTSGHFITAAARRKFEATPEWRKLERQIIALSTVPGKSILAEAHAPSLGERLDSAKARYGMTDKELWPVLGLKKTTYYAVRNNMGNRVTKLKVAQWLEDKGL